MKQLSRERLEEIRDYDTCVTLEESAEMARRLLAVEGQEPVGVVRAVNAPGEMTGLHVSLYEKLPVGTEVYAVPQPAPVAQPVQVPDEQYQHLSELYHAQEKRLFKIAQRIKGPSFDKYAHSPSQAIDVLESAIFGENNDACRAAMLSAPVNPEFTTQQGAVQICTVPDERATFSKDAFYEIWNALVDAHPDSDDADIGSVAWEVLGPTAYEAACRAAMLQPSSGALQLPDGWKLVPVELTCEMDDAAWDAYHDNRCMSDIYAAMLAAAPQEPTK